jgi:anti-sigma factor RsiW
MATTTSRDREPTREELLTMAYADGELDDAGRREFEQTLASRPDLGREVVQLQRLHILARNAAGPEPMDFEWARLERDVLHRAGIHGGLALLLIGAVGATGWGLWQIAVEDELGWGLKLLLGSLIAGALAMLLATVRARLRTIPYDPYTEIKR